VADLRRRHLVPAGLPPDPDLGSRQPFGYYERYSGADVSLEPLRDTARRLAKIAAAEGPPV